LFTGLASLLMGRERLTDRF